MFSLFNIGPGMNAWRMGVCILFLLCVGEGNAQSQVDATLGNVLPGINEKQSQENARPWVFWYWMHASVSKEGITADLEAMKTAGIGGAYLMSIKGPTNPPLYTPVVEQLSEEWWAMVKHALTEADRLGIKIGMHASDGFAVAGGPWITPENSMQKVVWTETFVRGEESSNRISLQKPETVEGFYRDIAVLAFPTVAGSGESTENINPTITTSKPGEDARFLIRKDNKENYRSDSPSWIQYAFEKPFTCRSIQIRSNGPGYQAHRLIIEVSDDGNAFRSVGRLQPPRHGWQDNDAAVTHAIEPTTARYFRFRFDPDGTEPGAEDLDAAKWKPTLRISGLELLSSPRIHQFEGKSGAVWRISTRTTSAQIPDQLCIQKENIIDLTSKVNSDGVLTWKVPSGKWTILRMGHTSTGHTNYTGGAGKGLECDKFNPASAKIQFENWFGLALSKAGVQPAAHALQTLLLDSWECGSQNWSTVFPEAFKERRRYDLTSYLPVMAGYPVTSADASERFLFDVRQTIAELVHDNFYVTLRQLAHEQECFFSSESIAPTMTSDGMLQYKATDVPMGEFWFRSPTHDKPNDLLDAVSGAHIYGKPIVQAESFTQLRMQWDEHPGMIKPLTDYVFARGINRLVYHVFTHNPWTDRKPGMTLDGVGLYFQRDQTWWKPGSAFTDYVKRCQTILQTGVPVTDLAVFTGEEIPRRAILPDRLVPILPGIFGDHIVDRERKRLANVGQPLREIPQGVSHASNMPDPEMWIDALNGYQYDSFNKDALLQLATVKNGRIELPGGASYAMLILPGAHAMSPEAKVMSPEVALKIEQLVTDGATVMFNEIPDHAPGLTGFPGGDAKVKAIANRLFAGTFIRDKQGVEVKNVGQGKIIKGPYRADSFTAFGIARDVVITDAAGNDMGSIAWTHRRKGEVEIYFLSNQNNVPVDVVSSFRSHDKIPSLYDPLTDEVFTPSKWNADNDRTQVSFSLAANGSMFVLLHPKEDHLVNAEKGDVKFSDQPNLSGAWTVAFDTQFGGPAGSISFPALTDWTQHADPAVKYYSGTAVYTKNFSWRPVSHQSKVFIDLGRVENIAEVFVNDISCGIAWTPPFRVDVTKALRVGENSLRIDVTNTWANRLMGDHTLPEEKRITMTTAPYRLEGKSLMPAGLFGPVKLITSSKEIHLRQGGRNSNEQ